VNLTGTADQGFGAHPFGEIARAMVAAQEQGLELAQAWSDSLRELVGNQAEGGRAALESFATTTRAQLELARTLLTRSAPSPRPSAAWSRAGTTPSCACWRALRAPGPSARPATSDPQASRSSGSRTWKRVSPGAEVKRRSPPWRWTTIRQQMSSPSPVPLPTGLVV
jgi:hypothetical protein